MQTKRERLNALRAQLEPERNSFRSYWRELSDYILPRRTQFLARTYDSGARKNLKIIDSTASMAVRTLSSGLMTGITSPARPWFKFMLANLGQKEDVGVRTYLRQAEEITRAAFLRSNLYNALPILYGDVGTFGTGAMYMEEDYERFFNFVTFPVGSYRIAVDKRGEVCVFIREFTMTVRQLIEKFGKTRDKKEISWDNLSTKVKDLWLRGQTEEKIEVAHIISPNENYLPNNKISRNKKFSSVYYELSNNEGEDKFLRESGYSIFPVLVPRWEIAGADCYGTNCPGMIALGDVKQLQFAEKRIAQALDQKVKPSMVGPTSLRNKKTTILPGEITYVDEREGMGNFRRTFEIDFDIRELEQKQEQIRRRISRVFYEDLFLMLINSNRKEITAREIDERHEEKLLALGPVLERLNQDLLDPLIENAYEILNEQGALPEPPTNLSGQDLKIEYISIMAQAQKLAGIGNIEKVVGFISGLTQIDPTAVMNLNTEETISLYAEHAGTDPTILRTKEEVEEIKAAQAQQMQQEQQQAAAQQEATTAKTMSETDMDTNSALQEMITSADIGDV